MPATRDFNWYQGEDFTFDVYYAIDGVAQDMTGYAVRMDISRVSSSGVPGKTLVTLNSEDVSADTDVPGEEDNEITLDTNGKIHVKVSREVTLDALNPAEAQVAYVYDLFLRDKATDTQRSILRGTILLTRAVTQWR